MKIAVLFADGTEEIEALTAVDFIRRAGASCEIVSTGKEYLVGSRGITVKADKFIDDALGEEYDAVVIPGGLKGARAFSDSNAVLSIIGNGINKGKKICAICASPALVLAKHGFLNGKTATCYPSDEFVSLMRENGANHSPEHVVVDGNFITADGVLSANEFALTVCKELGITPEF